MSNTNIRYCLAFVLIFVLCQTGLSQPAEMKMDNLAGRIQAVSKNTAPELIYIQTSKDCYETLEDLWFKTYILNAQIFAPSALSHTLYLEMLNEKTRQVVWQEKYPIQYGFASGHVYVNDTLPDGNYLLVAYTPYSFYGDSTELKAVRRIVVKKEIKAIPNGNGEQTSVPAPVNHEPIQFTSFPEGGNLVSGISGKLAFKAVNKQGIPVDVKGALYEDTTAFVSFQSTRAGMGSLTFTPQTGKKYYIRLSAPATDSVFQLPEVYPDGITLQLSGRDKENLEFKVLQTPSLKKRTIYLRGQVRGVVYCMATATLDKELTIKIPLEEFSCQGIAEFTLFNDSLQPVSERLVYVNADRKLYIETQLDKERYEARGKATLKITVKDERGQPVIANLGVNVFDKLYQNVNDPVNILSHYFLSSQIKGKIYDPAFYFDTQNQDKEASLDLLLLTQGWRRYVWSESALKENGNTKQKVISDGVTGEVHATKKSKKSKGLQQFVRVFFADNRKDQDLLTSDSTGNFTITPDHLKTGQGGFVYLKPLLPEEYEPRIYLSDPFETIHRFGKTKEISYPQPGLPVVKREIPENDYVEGHNSIKLAEVTVKGRGTATFRDKFIGHLDSIAKLDLCTDYVCWDCGLFSEKFPPPKGFKLVINCKFHPYDKSHKPEEGRNYVLRKGENIGNKTYTSETTIEYHYPKITEAELLEMNNLSRAKAYFSQREFYQPNYDKVDSLNDALADYRNTLLWAPSVITNEQGEATLSFFCSDINTRFVGVIEGVGSEGLLGSGEFEFFVRKRETKKPLK